jgi:hypothetical protein
MTMQSVLRDRLHLVRSESHYVAGAAIWIALYMYWTGAALCHGSLSSEDAPVLQPSSVQHSCSLMEFTRPEVSFGSMERLLKLCFSKKKKGGRVYIQVKTSFFLLFTKI